VQRIAGYATWWFDSAAKLQNGVGREGHNFVQILATKQAASGGCRRAILSFDGSYRNPALTSNNLILAKAILYRAIYSLRAENFQEKGK
jgi:hypothetical protein